MKLTRRTIFQFVAGLLVGGRQSLKAEAPVVSNVTPEPWYTAIKSKLVAGGLPQQITLDKIVGPGLGVKDVVEGYQIQWFWGDGTAKAKFDELYRDDYCIVTPPDPALSAAPEPPEARCTGTPRGQESPPEHDPR